MKAFFTIILLLISAVLFSLSACTNETGQQEPLSNKEVMEDSELPQQLRKLTSNWNTDWSIHSIPYDDLISGGPTRDGIPSIDEPKFVSNKVAEEWIAPDEPVMVVQVGTEVRAYPIQILIWHEIVNDTIDEQPIAVTYCPLCNSALVFNRKVKGEVYEFGVSGLLVHSDLVMYDRTTESLWQQLTGEVIVGELTGTQLDFMPSNLVSFDDFKQSFPNGSVLSKDTGFDRNYGQNPYPAYERRNTPYFGDNYLLLGEEPRLQPMERVVTISLNQHNKVYPYKVLEQYNVVKDNLGEEELVIFYKKGTRSALDSQVINRGEDVGASAVFSPIVNGKSLDFRKDGKYFIDQETKSKWNMLGIAVDGPLQGTKLTGINHGDHFWFAWIAFKPDTLIYTPEGK